tara:strand:+ start:272 stop:1396 length:1125 start_codon:yes stop_codon:yes gene_type:complete
MNELLTTATAAGYVASLDILDSATTASEIEGGNLNYAFRVSSSTSTASVFVKQAPNYIKCLGPDYALPSTRIAVEVDALRCYSTLAGAEFVPAVLHFDAARAIMVLEDLTDRVLLRDALASSSASVAAAHATAIGTFAARLHCASGEASTLAELRARFSNADMVGITRAYVFEKPLDAADETNRHSAALEARVIALRADPGITEAFRHAREEIFDGKPEALLHGDLHAGSVMVRPDGEGGVKVIDAEFAFVGGRGVDVGMVIAGYCFAWAAACASRGADGSVLMLGALRAFWAAYAAEGDAVVWTDATAIAGCDLVRRLLGAAHSPDVEAIEDASAKAKAEHLALDLGEALLRGEADSIDALCARAERARAERE